MMGRSGAVAIAMQTPRTRTIPLDRPLDLRLTLGPHRFGKGDPTCLLRSDEAFRATRTPIGSATLHLVVRGAELEASAWGAGADWVLEQVPELIGEDDRHDFWPRHPLVRGLLEQHRGLRIGASRRVFEALLQAVCAAAVSDFEGTRAHRQILARLGEPAPGPGGLTIAPLGRVLATTTVHELHPLGLERARADVLRRAAAREASVESVYDHGPGEADERLRSVAGVSGAVAARIRLRALGDADAVPVGDPIARDLVAHAFTGARRGTDAQMLELLEPFRGQRGRVVRLLAAGRLQPPRAGSTAAPAAS